MSRELRTALGHWATGVVVVTTISEDGADFGLTVNSFASVSLDPPLVLWSLQNHKPYGSLFSSGYCVNVLGSDQADLVWKFTRGTQSERFDGVSILRLSSGRARIAGAIAYFDCQLYNRVLAGDHTILIGEVLEYAAEARPPAVFNQGALVQVAC